MSNILRVYLDTSVPSHLYAPDTPNKMRDTLALWEEFRNHIAAAITSKCDVIASWNFKHIVNHKTIAGAKVIAQMEGYPEIFIYTPTFLLEDKEYDT